MLGWEIVLLDIFSAGQSNHHLFCVFEKDFFQQVQQRWQKIVYTWSVDEFKDRVFILTAVELHWWVKNISQLLKEEQDQGV